MKIDISQLNLPKVSPDGLAALDICTTDEPDLKALSIIIRRDPVLSTTLLKYANSPLYRRAVKITNVPAAIRVLGITNIRSAVAMATMRSVSNQQNAACTRIFDHCANIALLCQLICSQGYPDKADDLEFLGLVHDIGMLVLANNFPSQYQTIIKTSQASKQHISELEQETFDLTHDQIMPHVMTVFRISEEHNDLLSHYHARTQDHPSNRNQELIFNILDLAHVLWFERSTAENLFYEDIPPTRDELLDALQIGHEALTQILDTFDKVRVS